MWSSLVESRSHGLRRSDRHGYRTHYVEEHNVMPSREQCQVVIQTCRFELVFFFLQYQIQYSPILPQVNYERRELAGMQEQLRDTCNVPGRCYLLPNELMYGIMSESFFIFLRTILQDTFPCLILQIFFSYSKLLASS